VHKNSSRAVNTSFRLEKCCFIRSVTEFLVYVICPEGLKVDSEIWAIKGCIISADVSVLKHLFMYAGFHS